MASGKNIKNKCSAFHVLLVRTQSEHKTETCIHLFPWQSQNSANQLPALGWYIVCGIILSIRWGCWNQHATAGRSLRVKRFLPDFKLNSMRKQIRLRWLADPGNYNLLSSTASRGLARQPIGNNKKQTYLWLIQVILDHYYLIHLKLGWDRCRQYVSLWVCWTRAVDVQHHGEIALKVFLCFGAVKGKPSDLNVLISNIKAFTPSAKFCKEDSPATFSHLSIIERIVQEPVPV